MRTASIRIRLLVIAAVVALSVWAIYPPDQKIKLGLDLKGGVHLVLRVKTDDALQRQTQATGTALNDLRRETVQQALSTIERRVNELGVAEPVVALYGDADRILVQLPGIEDVESAKQIIKSTAQLRLTLVERGPFPSRAAALPAYDNTLPADSTCCPSGSTWPGPSTLANPSSMSFREFRWCRARTFATPGNRSMSSTGPRWHSS